MRNAFILIPALLLLLWSPVHSQGVDFVSLDSYIGKALSDWEVPGLAIAIVRDDSVVFARGYGVKTLGEPGPVDTHTLFAIASLSKAFTVACLGILVDQGKLRWDDLVTDYVPSFQLYDPYTTRELTVRDLLCHRSGLVTFGGDLIWYGTTYDRQEVLRRIRYLKPAHSFRARYGYQNILYLAAGEVLPAITGVPWDIFVRDSILLPLGMTETNTTITAFTPASNVATPHTKHRGAIIPIPYRNVDNVGSAASLNSSVHDLSKWIRMWLRSDTTQGPRRISNAVRNEVWSPHTFIRLSERALADIPSRHFRAAGLGWFVFNYRGRKIVEHSGGMDGMISRLFLVPEENLGAVILTNSINALPEPLMFHILDQYLGGTGRDWSATRLRTFREGEERRQASARKMEEERVKKTRPSLALDAYTGLYGGPLYGNVRVTMEKGRLVARFLPTATFVGDLTHWHYDTFRIELRDPTLPPGTVNFFLDTTGKVSEMVVHIPNPDFDFRELELKRLSD